MPCAKETNAKNVFTAFQEEMEAALDEPLLEGDEAEFEDDDEEWLDVESEDGWPAELR